MTNAQKYKMSFSSGGLFINESVEIARLYVKVGSWADARSEAVDSATTMLPKEASQRRTVREIFNRVSCLTNYELNYLVDEADRYEQCALLWLATCRAYRFIREFAVEVIRERYLGYRLDLPLEQFDIFLDAKAEWDEHLSGLSQTTRLKLRQIMFRIMREAGVIDDQRQIQKAILSKRLTLLIAEKSAADLDIFPGATAEGMSK